MPVGIPCWRLRLLSIFIGSAVYLISIMRMKIRLLARISSALLSKGSSASGQSVVEYALILSVVALTTVGGLVIFGGGVGGLYDLLCGEVVPALGGGC